MSCIHVISIPHVNLARFSIIEFLMDGFNNGMDIRYSNCAKIEQHHLSSFGAALDGRLPCKSGHCDRFPRLDMIY